MRKIAFVVGVVGAAALLLRRLQGEKPVPAYVGQPMQEKQRVAIPFDDLADQPVTQAADYDDLPLSPTPVIVNHTEDVEPEVLREPLLPFAEMPVEDVHPTETNLIFEPEITAENVIEPQIAESADSTGETDFVPLVTAEVEDLPILNSEQ